MNELQAVRAPMAGRVAPGATSALRDFALLSLSAVVCGVAVGAGLIVAVIVLTAG